MPNFIETEVKLWVADLESVKRQIEVLGGVLAAPRVYEKNVRYEDQTESLTPAGRVLRLRQDSRVRLTYKEPFGEEAHSRTEIELIVDDFTSADLFLKKLGFKAAWVYEKYRTTFHLQACEIVLDETPIGNFVEVEGESVEVISVLVAQLGLGDAPHFTQSYSDLFFGLRDQLHLSFRDMTFENFVTVDHAKIAHALVGA
ncbi:MAG: hypothetical protein OHK0023_23350 [Anaerolineae bacterium]